MIFACGNDSLQPKNLWLTENQGQISTTRVRKQIRICFCMLGSVFCQVVALLTLCVKLTLNLCCRGWIRTFAVGDEEWLRFCAETEFSSPFGAGISSRCSGK